MASSATVTAKTGPNIQATAQSIPNFSRMVLDPDRRLLSFYQGGDDPVAEFDLTGVTTFTVTPSGSGANYAVTVS